METKLPPHLVVIEHELSGVTIQSPVGLVRGYQLRYLAEAPAPPLAPANPPEWSPRYFLTEQALEDLVRTTTHYLHTEGHLAVRAPPGSSVQ
jgi:hypothetical protein